MEYTVESNPPKSIESLPSVTLELSAGELILLAAVVYNFLSGISEYRDSLEEIYKAFEKVTNLPIRTLGNSGGQSNIVLDKVRDSL